MNKQITPVGGRERIDYLDVLRGIAILGILFTNINWFSLYSKGINGPFHFAETDSTIGFLQYVFIEGKFYSIFSLLFGWGIAMQLSKFANNDKSASKFLQRRLFFMMLLGSIHMLFIWEGDIVFFYALVGFGLVALRNFSNKTLLITGILLILSPILLYYLKLKFPVLNAPVEILINKGEQIYGYKGWINQDVSRTDVLIESRSILTNVWINLADAPYRFAYIFYTSRISKILGVMLIGFVIGRSQFYPKIMEHKRKLFAWSAIAFILLLPLNYLVAKYMTGIVSTYSITSEGLILSILYTFGVFPLALVYMSFIALAFEIKKIRKLLLFISPVGKMAFSNYIMQSLIGILIFYGIGFGLAQKFGLLMLTIIALIIFIIQLIYSNIWLRYFRFGPLEWIWRSLTYGKQQPFKK